MSAAFAAWRSSLHALCDRIARAARAAADEGLALGDLGTAARAVHDGAGDVAFAVDVPAEDALTAWLHEEARTRPLSLLTEDAGWRHRGPAAGGGVRTLDGFDHGGPRIVVDPIDGSRNLLADLRSAWTVIGFAPPGAGQPRLSELTAGLLSEIPTSRARARRRFEGTARGCRLEEREGEAAGATRPHRADDDDRADRGYFPFFRHHPALRPALAAVEAEFFARLEREEGADLGACWDDQYISNGGQLALLMGGTYRMIADLRAELARRRGAVTQVAKPYDVAGAVVCARAAGCVVEDPSGADLDCPIDATTPVAFVGWVNRATAARLGPHLRAALAAAV